MRSTAGATRIEIATVNRWSAELLLRVTDNGSGMTPGDLELAVRRHCTSARRQPVRHSHPRLPRRGPAVDRFGRPAVDHDTQGNCASRRSSPLPEGKTDPVRPSPQYRHGGRGTRPVLRHPGPAEVHEDREGRSGRDFGSGAPHGDRVSGGPASAALISLPYS